MSLIFYDLETSDKEPCGQILNYSFIRTDNKFKFLDELSGNISLSVLQIPSPDALLTNRVRILDHQAQRYPSEPESMLAIARFIATSIEQSSEPTFLVGYNSTRFDLPFLRTSLIRNGINPYFAGKLKYKDVLHLVRKLYVCNEDFPTVSNARDVDRLSLSLESCASAFKLLEGTQSHHSREDVLLTIALCECLNKKFGAHIRDFQAYEPGSSDKELMSLVPEYDLKGSKDRKTARALALLSDGYRSALWIDVERYKAGEGRGAISWYNKNGGQIMICTSSIVPQDDLSVIQKARQEFAGLNPDNFFSRSSCDIEQDIYRLDMQKISVLGDAIWNKNRAAVEKVSDKDLQELVARHWLAYGLHPQKRGDKWTDRLALYARYRYGEKSFQLAKSLPDPIDPEKESFYFHPSALAIQSYAFQKLQEKSEPEDKEIISQLLEYMRSSPLLGAFADLQRKSA